MNSHCGRPRVLRAASVMAVVALALAVAPAAHANGMSMWYVSPEQEAAAFAFLKLIGLVVLVVYAAVVALVGWLTLRAAARSTRPWENTWAAWSLILGLASLPLCPLGPFAVWTGITAYRIGGSKRTAVSGIVLGGLTTLAVVGCALIHLYYIYYIIY